jgi:hypothetical protein
MYSLLMVEWKSVFENEAVYKRLEDEHAIRSLEMNTDRYSLKDFELYDLGCQGDEVEGDLMVCLYSCKVS